MKITRIDLDSAKNVSEAHGVDQRGVTVPSDTSRPPGWIRLRVPLCCIGLLLVVGARLFTTGEANYSNDSYQYLSVAENTLRGQVGESSLIHWDEDRLSGKIPAPMTSFPIGYSALIALIAFFGVPPEAAGMMIALASTLAAIFFLDQLAARFHLSPIIRTLILVGFAASDLTLQYAMSIMSEAAFMLAVLAGLLVLQDALVENPDRRWNAGVLHALFAGALLGAAYWIRYAELFVLLGVLAFAVAVTLLKIRPRWFKRQLFIACGTGFFLAGLAMLRNQWLVGSWRGGNNKYVFHSYLLIAHDYAIAGRDLLLGNVEASNLLISVLRLMTVASLAAALAYTFFSLQRKGGTMEPRQSRPRASPALLLMVIATYLCGLIYAASRTAIDRDLRYIFPIYPELLVVAGIALQGCILHLHGIETRRRNLLVWGLFTAVFAASQLFQLLGIHQPSRHALLQDEFRQPIGPYRDLKSLIDAQVGKDETIMANTGQAIGWMADRKTVSLIVQENSKILWTEETVQTMVSRYNVKLLIIHGATMGPFTIEMPSEFVSALAQGRFPAWLRLIGNSNDLYVYAPRSAT